MKGQFIAGGSDLIITDVESGANGGLICRTDQSDCCNSQSGRKRGEWRLPNGLVAGKPSAGGDFYVTRQLRQVLLNRRNNALGPLGRYCCEVDTVADPNAKICVNLGML